MIPFRPWPLYANSRFVGTPRHEIQIDVYAVSQDLTGSRVILPAIRKLVFWSIDVPNF
jgi:hypothetical protein